VVSGESCAALLSFLRRAFRPGAVLLLWRLALAVVQSLVVVVVLRLP
jgi:hypothetical protein